MVWSRAPFAAMHPNVADQMQENGPGTGPFSDPTRGRVRGMPRATAP